MINEAMFTSRNQFNEFTRVVRMMAESSDMPAKVKLRNGLIVDVLFAAASEGDNMLFRTSDWEYVWYLDGSSIKSKDFDMCWTGADIK
jgi:hypothetical protein